MVVIAALAMVAGSHRGGLEGPVDTARLQCRAAAVVAAIHVAGRPAEWMVCGQCPAIPFGPVGPLDRLGMNVRDI